MDFITSVGFLTGGTSRRDAGLSGLGPVAVITDLCIFRPEPGTFELTVSSIHKGIERDLIRKKTGWDVRFAADCAETELPTEYELDVLRDLKHRTAIAQGQTMSEV